MNLDPKDVKESEPSVHYLKKHAAH